ncbi:integrase catalytic domain-containing protein [Trichonephila clavata]|uniref:Integrase catalytic domain-containing protein n=1 Tax=Trichonephila clavata TaxID=2740835 RepID=A0A8X6LAH6_TRICU|nr:integrase catalytic domain-containing protein [Trichonephila clavata]
MIQPAKDMPSSAELLMGRKLRTFLPSHPGQLKPTFDVERAREALSKRQIIQNKYANKHATVLPVLHQNAKVWFKHKMKELWKQGTVIQELKECTVMQEEELNDEAIEKWQENENVQYKDWLRPQI